MRARTMAGLLTRLDHLEGRTKGQRRLRLRLGHLKRLPRDYEGERHIVIAGQLPNKGDQEWAEFEERAGPIPTRRRKSRGSPSTWILCSSRLTCPTQRQDESAHPTAS
jgi:hypothetical protein